MADKSKQLDPSEGSELRDLKSRNEILQVMYWMSGEGLGEEFSVSDLQKFLAAKSTALERHLGLLIASKLVRPSGDEKFALTEQGRLEGGRQFGDEFNSMIKPGHFECNEPDCDCQDPELVGEVCKHFVSA